MSDAETLRKIREKYASVLREACERVLADLPTLDAALKEQLQKVRKLAAETEELAAAPVKIGVVGEFSSGKTLLLGSLIGYADALPVSELPTTGNVTSLEFEPVDELQTTVVGPFTVEYLDHAGVEECLEFMLKEARARADAAMLRPELKEALGRIPSGESSALPLLEKWCADAWSASNNPNLRYLLRELVAFIRAYARCGAGMCSRPEKYQVSAETARRGLQLTPPERELQGLSFAELPPAPPPLSTPPSPDTLTAAQLKATFPLIRRVAVRVKLSRAVWDLAGLTGANRFVLLDFPGLGAANSGSRDLFLCLRELKEVQTILIVMRGDQPGSGEAAQLYDLMQSNREGDIRDTILVGIGRFDQLPLDAADQEKLRHLAGPTGSTAASPLFADEEEPAAPNTGPLTDSTVYAELPILKTCIQGGQDLAAHGRNDRIVLLSPMLHLKHLQDNALGIQAGSPNFLANLPANAAHGQERCKEWKAVARRLQTAGPGGTSHAGLRRWLDDVAADGGVSRLRDLIRSHVQQHGLQQLSETVLRRAELLRQEVARLRERLPPPPGGGKDLCTPEDVLEDARKRFARLAELYQQVTNQITKGLPLEVEQDGRRVPITDVVLEEVSFQIFEWGQWEALWQASRNGYITQEERTAGGGVLFKDEGEEEEARLDEFPVRSDDLYGRFEDTLRTLEELTRKQIDAGLDCWLNRLAADTAADRRALGETLANPQLPARVRTLKLGTRGQGLVPVLRAAIDPLQLKRQVYLALGVPEGDPAKFEAPLKLNSGQLFPLARSRGDTQGRFFAWARELQKGPENVRPERNHSHQCQILRLRDEFVTTLSHELCQLASLGVKLINKGLQEVLKLMNEKLGLVAGNDVILDALMQKAAGGPDTPAALDPLAGLRGLAAVAWPL